MKLMPASSAAWMTATDSSWSGLPQAPNIIAPRQRGLTFTPVRPRVRYFIAASSSRATPGPLRRRTSGDAAEQPSPASGCRAGIGRRASEERIRAAISRSCRSSCRAPVLVLREGVRAPGTGPAGSYRIAACCSSTGWMVAAVLMPGRALHHARSPRGTWPRRVLEVERELGQPGHVLHCGECLVDRLLDRQVDTADRLLARAGEHAVPRRGVVPVLALRGLGEGHDRRWHGTEAAPGRGVDARLVRADGEVLERRRERDDREVTGELLRPTPRGPRPGARVDGGGEATAGTAPDERDATEHRAATEQERPAARRRRTPSG